MNEDTFAQKLYEAFDLLAKQERQEWDEYIKAHDVPLSDALEQRRIEEGLLTSPKT